MKTRNALFEWNEARVARKRNNEPRKGVREMNEAHAKEHEEKFGRKVWGIYPFLAGCIYRWKGEMLYDDPADMPSAMSAREKYNILACLEGSHVVMKASVYKRIPVHLHKFTEQWEHEGRIITGHFPPDFVYDGKDVIGMRT